MNPGRLSCAVNKLLSMILLSSLLLLNPGGNSVLSVQAQVPERENSLTLTGILGVVWSDKYPSENREPQVYFFDESGSSYLLDIPLEIRSQLGGIHTFNNQHVRIMGVIHEGDVQSLSDASPAAIEVTSMDFLFSASQADASSSDSKPWVNVLCKFSDVPDEPEPVSYFENLFGDDFGNINHYWQTVSYGNINTDGSMVVTHWYTLPKTRASYIGSNGSINLHSLATDCTAAANADVYYPAYFGINLMFNTDLNGYAWGGGWYLSLDGVNRYFPLTWMPPWGYQNQSSMVHEMGHAFGLPHSSGPYGGTYDSEWDVMSSTWECIQYTDYGCLGTDTISYHKYLLGWIPSTRRYDAKTGTSRSLVLERLNGVPASVDTFMMARVLIPGSSRFYTVEVRDNITDISSSYLPFDEYEDSIPSNNYGQSASPNAPVVVIHEVDRSRANEAQVVDATLNDDPNDEGAMWRPGETFIDPVNNIRIAILSPSGTGYLVRIGNGDAPNNGISNPLVVNDFPFSFDEDTTTTDTDINDPLIPCGGNIQGDGTVWFKFKPANYGIVSIDTNGSNFDTLLSVWEGVPGALQNVACDDDGGDAGTSSLEFDATSNMTYYIEVAGKNAQGDLSFHLDMEACYSATLKISPGAAGTASILTAPNCAGSYYFNGTSVTYSAVPNDGYAFKSWSGSHASPDNPLTIPIDSNQTITANFVPTASTPTLLTPANSSLTTDYTPTLKWKPANMPAGTTFDHYQLQVAADVDFGAPLFDEDIADILPAEFVPSELTPNARYYWRIRIYNTLGNVSNWSKIYSFRTALTPPTPVSPLNGFASLELRPPFDWDDDPDANGYLIQISTTPDFAKPILKGNAKTSYYVPTKDLPKDVTLYWRVQTKPAKGSNGPSDWSEVRSLTTPVNPPPATSLLLPKNNALTTDYTPLLTWKPILMPLGTDFQNYIIQVDDDPLFGSPAVNDASITDPSILQFEPVSALAPNMKYYWRVRAVNTDGELSNWSKVLYFRTAILPPMLLTPLDGATNVALKPTLDWEDVIGASGYNVQVSLSPTFSTKIVSASTVSSTYTFLKNLPSGVTLYWRVQAKGSNGPSLWSVTFSFVTP